MDPTAHKEVLDYAQKNHLSYLMEHLMSRVLLEQPLDPRSFLVQELNNMLIDKSYLFSYTKQDLETLYNTLVQTPQAPKNIMELAMKELGCFDPSFIEQHKSTIVNNAEDFASQVLCLLRNRWSA
ncbi:hypothetical protein RCL1_000545 [Eukaryota sp. TZLM3-RCL]